MAGTYTVHGLQLILLQSCYHLQTKLLADGSASRWSICPRALAESCVLGPAHMPDLVKKAEQLLRSAHSVHVAHGVNNARMSQYRTISNQFRTRANNIAAYRTWLRTLVSAGSKFVKYPVKLST